MTDLSIIAPEAMKVRFHGRDIDITPLKVGQLPAFTRAIKPIAGALQGALSDGGMNAALIMEVLAEGEHLVEAISIATGVPAAELNESTPDELVGLASQALKVNGDFFKGRLTPAILAAVKAHQARPATNGDGPTP